ncbi:MAG: sugar phosphate isomerase/epimerase [bacterium]|nr:sugar phosphate isomerase/epimerase [bacterium]
MFKLGIITDEISQDFEQAVAFAKKNNLDFVELRSVWDKPPQALDTSDIWKIKELLKRTELKVTCIASPVFKCHIDKADEYQEHLDFLKRCINLAHQLNTNIIRIFTFWKKNLSLEQHWDLLINRFGSAVELAKKENIKLAIENEHSCLVGTGQELAQFMEILDSNLKYTGSHSQSVYALWDPCNEIFAGVTEPPYPNGFNYIATRIIHLHIKDAIRVNAKYKMQNLKQILPEGGEPKCVPIGEGWIDWQGQLQALINLNYRGGVSLETHWRPKKELSESKLSLPGGTEFSSLGEEASQVCLNRVFDILTKLNIPKKE